ncbi:Hypothetical predicted protein, partial [Xyrichtys novacula]
MNPNCQKRLQSEERQIQNQSDSSEPMINGALRVYSSVTVSVLELKKGQPGVRGEAEAERVRRGAVSHVKEAQSRFTSDLFNGLNSE